MKMRGKIAADLTVIAILTLWIHTTQSSRQSPKCPIGFELAYTKSKGEAVCYRLKGPETFADKFKGCAGNRYTFKLYTELAIKYPSFLKLWGEYKSAYPGGPFIDWSYTESAGDLLVRSYEFNVPYDLVKGLDEECLFIEDVPNARNNPNFTSARCDEQYYRFCMVEPYSDRQYSCEQFEDSWRFWTPRTTCLARVTALGGGAVRATWKQATELCAKRGASLLHRGWVYANNMVFQPTRNMDIPLGAVITADGYNIIWSDTEDGNNQIPVDELNSLGVSATDRMSLSSIQDKTTLALRFHEEDDVKGAAVINSTLFYDVVCERSIHLRNVDMRVDVYSDRRIKLLMNDSVDDNGIYCFTDSSAYYPTSVEIKRDNDSVYDLKPARNGYYWCMHYDSTNYRVAESNKALFVRKDRSLENLFAIKIRTIDDYDLKDLDKLYKFWEKSLREYILCRTRFYEINGHNNISDEAFLQEYNLQVFKKKRPDLLWRVNVIESMRLKRVLRDGKTALLHVDISPEMKQAPPGKWGNLEVLYMKPAYYCPETDFSPFAELGKSVTTGCFTFTCVGDFNEGVQWVETAVEDCTTRPSQWVDTAITFRDPFPSSFVVISEKAQRTSIRQESSSDSSEEFTKQTAVSVTTTTTDTNSTQVSETVSTVNPPTEEVTTVDTPPPPPPSPPTTTTTTTTQVPTTVTPPDEQLKQVLEDLENLLQNDTIPVQVEDIDDAFDRVDVLLEEEEDLEIPGELLHLLDQLGARVNLNGSQSASTVRGNIAMLMADASPKSPVRGLRIATRESDVFTNNAFEIISDEVNSTHLTTDVNEAVVHLPQSISETTRRISFVVFRTDRAFHSGQGHYSVNSRVLSINVENITQFEQGEVIDIHLTPMLEDPDRNMSRACAYWHFLENGTGFWSQEGCTFIRSTNQSLMDTCRCDHLTHFAEILVPRSVFSQTNEDVLEILSIVGCCVSIFGLLIIGLTAILFRSWRRDFSNKIWLQLCLAIFLLAVCFLVIVFVKFTEYDVFCMLMGVALHYSVLASFCWMLVAAVLSYRRLVLVFARDASHKLLRASAFSWGAPCAIVGILLSVSPHSYAGRFEEKTPTGSFCYPSGLGLWLSVYTPIAVMLIANWTLFILIVRSVFASKRIQRHGDTNEAFRCASVSCLLVFLFGLPWIFGLFAYNIVAAYLFTLTVTLQGFVLFLFFVLCNKKTRDLWLNKLKIKQTRKVPVTSSTYTNKSTGSGWRSATNTSKPRSLASPDDTRFS